MRLVFKKTITEQIDEALHNAAREGKKVEEIRLTTKESEKW